MIEKMKLTPKAKHGWRVWIRQVGLVDDVYNLNMFLQCDEVFFTCDVQYNKPTILMYTDDDEVAEWIDKIV